MAAGLTARLDSNRTRGWRSMLAVLLSLMLVLSSSHCWCLDLGGGAPAVTIATNDGDAGKTSNDAHVPHCDHCMAHVITVTPPAASVAVEYVTGFYRMTASLVPDAAELASPFKPPRA